MRGEIASCFFKGTSYKFKDNMLYPNNSQSTGTIGTFSLNNYFFQSLVFNGSSPGMFYGFDNNALFIKVRDYSNSSFAYAYRPVLREAKNGLKIRFDLKFAGGVPNGDGSITSMIGFCSPYNNTTTFFLGMWLSIYNNLIRVYRGDTLLTSIPMALTDTDTFCFGVYIDKNNFKIKVWKSSQAEPTYAFTYAGSVPIYDENLYFMPYVYAQSGDGSGCGMSINLISVYNENSINITAVLPNQTGNKITTSIALPINDSANESPSISGLAGYLG